MKSMKRVLLGLLVAALVFAVAAGAARRDEGKTFLKADVVGSVPSDPPIHGVGPGGVPWLGGGEVTAHRDGRLKLKIDGLIIPALGNPDGVMTISASLFCGSDATPAATTPQVPLSREGDAKIDTTLALPPSCLGPVVLVHPNGITSRYIAATGFRS